jgi:hypothetical protein
MQLRDAITISNLHHSMKIMRPHFQGATRKGGQARCLHMNHAILVLQRTFHEEELASGHDYRY